MSPKHQRVIQIDLPCETALELTQQTLGLIGARVYQVDPEQGVVLAKGGLTSQPQLVDVRVSLVPQPEGCNLTFRSQSPFHLIWSDLLVDWNNSRYFERMLKQVEALYRKEQAHPELVKPRPRTPAAWGNALDPSPQPVLADQLSEPYLFTRLRGVLMMAAPLMVALAARAMRSGETIQALCLAGGAIVLGAVTLLTLFSSYVPPILRFRTEKEQKRARLAHKLSLVGALTLSSAMMFALIRDWTLVWISLGASALVWGTAVLIDPQSDKSS